MNSNKLDLRVRKTREALKSSFIELIKHVPIEKLTINEICIVAKVNRITFYNHYHDKYDLFNSIISDKIDIVKSKLEEEKKNFDMKNYIKSYVICCTKLYIDLCFENSEFIHSIVTFQDNSILQYIYKNWLEKCIRTIIASYYIENKNSIPIDLYVSCISGAVYSLTTHCVTDENKYSKEDLYKYAISIIESAFDMLKNKTYSFSS